MIYEAKFRGQESGGHCYNRLIEANSIEEAQSIADEEAGDEMWAEVTEGRVN
ncbi:MAG: hypothetical protein Q4G60_14595 [bacterium]|nr:hypothetical protein [bacterium]